MIRSRVIEFLLIWVAPRWGGGGGGWGVKWGFGDDVGMTGTTWGRHGDDGEDGEDTSIMINMLVAICNILRVCVHACVHVHACVCVCTCVRTPPIPQTTHLPPPHNCREPKTPKFNNS